MIRKKFIVSIAVMLILVVGAVGVSSSEIGNSQKNVDETTEIVSPSIDDVYEELNQTGFSWDEAGVITRIFMEGESVSIDGKGAVIDGKDIIIEKGGQYELTGILSDGRIVVDAKDSQVLIKLNEVDISCSYSSAIYSYESENTVIILSDDTENCLVDSLSYNYNDEYSKESELEPNACIYSKTDLYICGSGGLVVNGRVEQGITGKDKLRIMDANIQVSSVGKGVLGKDALTIINGNIVIDAADDGLHSNGNIALSGGNYVISSEDDGIHGDFVVACFDADIDVTKSNEGVEGYYVLCENSNIDITSTDDGFNATDGLGGQNLIEPPFPEGGGMLERPDAGEMPVPERGGMLERPDIGEMPVPEGGGMLERPDAGEMPVPEGGEMKERPDAGEMPVPEGGEMKERPDKGQPPFSEGKNIMEWSDIETESSQKEYNNDELGVGIEFRNCNIVVDAGGDGIDSNGLMLFDGGEYLIYGSASGGNAGLDYETECSFLAGTLVVVDVTGMNVKVPVENEVYGIDISLENYVDKGDELQVCSEGEEVNIEVIKKANHITVITPNMKYKDTCSIVLNGKQVASLMLENNMTYSRE